MIIIIIIVIIALASPLIMVGNRGPPPRLRPPYTHCHTHTHTSPHTGPEPNSTKAESCNPTTRVGRHAHTAHSQCISRPCSRKQELNAHPHIHTYTSPGQMAVAPSSPLPVGATLWSASSLPENGPSRYEGRRLPETRAN